MQKSFSPLIPIFKDLFKSNKSVFKYTFELNYNSTKDMKNKEIHICPNVPSVVSVSIDTDTVLYLDVYVPNLFGHFTKKKTFAFDVGKYTKDLLYCFKAKKYMIHCYTE